MKQYKKNNSINSESNFSWGPCLGLVYSACSFFQLLAIWTYQEDGFF